MMDPLHVSIDRMTPDDRSTVFALAEEVLKPLAQASAHADLFREEQFLALMDRAEVWVAREPDPPGEIAGYAVVEAGEGCLTTRCVCISPGYEGRHVGHRLLEWIEGLAYNRGLTQLEASLARGDRASLHLFQAQGYVAAQERAAQEEPVIVMRKQLQ